MSPIKIESLNDVEAWKAGGSPFPLGKHPGRIDSVEEKAASTGSPQVEITWTGLGSADGCEMREWLVILPQTYGKVKAFLEAVRWPLKEGAFDMPTTELVGRQAMLVVGTELRDAREFRRVMGHLPMEGDVPIDTSGLPTGAGMGAGDNQKLPF